jgi:hypothetical protein
MIRFTRQNTIWMAALSVMMALVIVSSGVAAEAQAVLLAFFMLALAGSLVDFERGPELVQSLQERSARSRMSAPAREAADRARNRPGYRALGGIQMIDVGVIASQNGDEGLVMRRTRSVSRDDDGMRPFVALEVSPEEADRNAVVRFEVIDQNGREQYIHEMDVYLRDGEMNILTDNHLPLRRNEQVAGMGDWDVRIFIDGTLVGIHSIALTASSDERRQRLQGNQYYVMGAEEREKPGASQEESPMSLEELLRRSGRS